MGDGSGCPARQSVNGPCEFKHPTNGAELVHCWRCNRANPSVMHHADNNSAASQLQMQRVTNRTTSQLLAEALLETGTEVRALKEQLRELTGLLAQSTAEKALLVKELSKRQTKATRSKKQ